MATLLPSVTVVAPVRAAGRPAGTGFLPEVHALRALAIVLVVAYHVAPGAAPGGYIGVDVLLVISGFLVTRQLVTERARTGRTDVVAFYARRARRLLPAAAVVIATVVVVGLAVLPPTRWADLASHGRAAALFDENRLLADQAVDYLSEGTAPSPLQHFWSLSVEAQFYAMWPAYLLTTTGLVWAARWAGTRWWPSHERVARRAPARLGWTTATAVLVAVSLAACLVRAAGGSAAAYFATPLRLWELASGGVIALLPRRSSTRPWGASALAGGGVVAVVVAALVLGPGVAYPGPWTLLPVVGAAAVVLAAVRANEPTWVGRAGSRPVVRWLGDISYSLYLWHWPVVVMSVAALPFLGRPGLVVVQVVVSLVLADLSRRFVELPLLRSRRFRGQPRATALLVVVLTGAVLAAAAVPHMALAAHAAESAEEAAHLMADPPSGLGAGSITADGFRSFARGTAIVPDPTQARRDLPARTGECKAEMGAAVTPRCVFGDPAAAVTIALVGDSHIEQYVPAFESVAQQNGWRVVTYLHASCPFSSAQRVSDEERGGPCAAANEETLAQLVGDEDIDLVVTSQRTAVPFVDDSVRPAPEEGFVDYWSRLARAGLPVLVIRDNPLMLPDGATQDCVAEHRADPSRCARSEADAVPDDPQVAAAGRVPGVSLVSPRFCAQGTCPAVIGNVLVYRDEQHLTATYVRTLADEIGRAVTSALGAA